MANYLKLEADDEDDDLGPTVQPRRIAIAKLIAACYLEQEAAILSTTSIPFDNPEDIILAKHVLAKVKARLRASAKKLREQ